MDRAVTNPHIFKRKQRQLHLEPGLFVEFSAVMVAHYEFDSALGFIESIHVRVVVSAVKQEVTKNEQNITLCEFFYL